MRRAVQAFYQRVLDPSTLGRWVVILGLPCFLLRSSNNADSVFAKLHGERARDQLCKLFAPQFSFDRASIHGGRSTRGALEVLQAIGLRLSEFFDLPPRSGADMHCVIEHTHARLLQAFQQWLALGAPLRGAQPVHSYKAVLEHLFYNCPSVAQPAVIEEDVRRLPYVLMMVAAHGGGEVSECA